MCGGFGMLGLADLLAGDAFGAAVHTVGPHFAPRAKHVIVLFMPGGPSQMDMFDPKPALVKYAGQRPATADLRTERTTGGLLPSPFRFSKHGRSGIEISELLPHLGDGGRRLCVVRSMYTFNPTHKPARSLFHRATCLSRPSMGAWISYGLGTENQNLPGFVVLAPDGGGVHDRRLPAGGVSGDVVQHLRDRTGQDDPVPAQRHARTPTRSARSSISCSSSTAHESGFGQDEFLEGRIQAMEAAFRMQFAAMDAFDSARAGVRARGVRIDAVRQRLPAGAPAGRARRAVVVVHYGPGQPWDDHKPHRREPARALPRHGPGRRPR